MYQEKNDKLVIGVAMGNSIAARARGRLGGRSQKMDTTTLRIAMANPASVASQAANQFLLLLLPFIEEPQALQLQTKFYVRLPFD